MGNLHLKINPDIVILHRNGVIFTSNLANNAAQQQLQVVDLILINEFFNNNNVNDVTNRFLKNKYLRHLAPAIESSMVQQQIDNLLNCKVLVKSSHSNNKEETVSQLRKEIEQQTVFDDDIYRLSSNFALKPGAGGFQIWSSIKNTYYLLGLEELLILTLIASGNSISKLSSQLNYIETNLITAIFNNLVQEKLLVKLKAQSNKQVNAEQALRKRTNKTMPKWQQIQADNRIPIYFVPHMENHFPLALGLLYSSIQNHDDGRLLEQFNLIPITYFTPETLLNVVYRKFGRGLWLFSNYMWSLELNLEISRLVKSHDANNLTIHGGPSTPNYQQASFAFMDKNNSIDISVHGEGEKAIHEILDCINPQLSPQLYSQTKLKNVHGITFRVENQKFNDYVRTKDRVRMEQPDFIPSPYINGVFDHYDARVDAAIIESNRGCPFGCTFCDWGSATNQKVRKYDLARTKKEINWIGKNKVRIIWIADANFGMYDRDIELSAQIAKIKQKYGYPQEVVVNYTKNTTWRLAEIIKIFTKANIISQGIISIQTTDKITLEVINRKNIKTEKYDELAKVFADEKLPLSTDLMLGLPGITVDAFNQDLQKYIDLDVSVKAYPTQLLPNSPMADPEYIKKYKIKTDENDFIISSYSFSVNELQAMKKIYKYYTIAEGYSLLRYIMRYLQWQHGIKVIDFLYKLMQTLEKSCETYPLLTWVFKYFDTEKCVPGGWHLFYQEIALFVTKEYSIDQDIEFATVVDVNQLCMPDDTQTYPLKVQLNYDFEKYFIHRNKKMDKNLSSLDSYRQSTIFKVSDPDSMAHVNHEELQYDTHQYFWELNSPIARAKSIVNA